MNALCVSYGSFREGNDLNALICGGVDKFLRVYDRGNSDSEGNNEPTLCREYEFSAPILSIGTYGTLVSCSFMDGRHALIDLSLPMAISPPRLYQTHNKYVVGTGWSSDGKYLYTCSHDKSIALFRLVRSRFISHSSLTLTLSPLPPLCLSLPPSLSPPLSLLEIFL
jgi:WD40 repeat protein